MSLIFDADDKAGGVIMLLEDVCDISSALFLKSIKAFGVCGREGGFYSVTL